MMKTILLLSSVLIGVRGNTVPKCNSVQCQFVGNEMVTKKSDGPVPVVMWHAMGGYSTEPGLEAQKALIEETVPGIYVTAIKTAPKPYLEIENCYFGNVKAQIDRACEQLRNDPALKNGYTGIGFSQGCQFMRGLAQRCSDPPMLNYISIGGQQQGVYSFPRCPGENKTICDIFRKMINIGAYTYFIQRLVVPAQYWHDSDNEFEYQHKSIFIADLNNELSINQTYKDNIIRLNNFVMVKFTKDRSVDPVESSWFGFYKPGQGKEIISLRESKIYLEDRIGLKALDEKGKIHFFEIDADHLQMSLEWFKENIVLKFLK